MDRNKLEKEAKEYADWFWGASPSMMKALARAYIEGAEPREKQLQEKDKKIEKMKCCGNCSHFKTLTDALYPIDMCELKYPNRCKNKDHWELAE